MVSEINQALIHISDEQVLLNDACRVAVDVGEYLMAWVGYAQQDAEKNVSMLASAGVGVEYAQSVNVVWSDVERGRGPTGTAIRTGQTKISKDIASDPKMSPWKKQALRWGYKSSIALPLRDNGKVFGALTIYADEVDAFDEEKVEILEELASDLAFGILTQRNRIEQNKMADQIQKNEKALLEAQRIGHFGNWEWDAKTDKINWSQEYYRIIGFDPKKSPPGYEEHLKIYTPESASRLDLAVKKNMKTGEPYMLDLEIAKPKSEARWITARSETIYGSKGEIIGLRGTAQDITDRKINEQKLSATIEEREAALIESKKLAMIVENTFEAVALIDLGKTNLITYVNRAWENMFDLKKEQVIKKREALIMDVVNRDPELKTKFSNSVLQKKDFNAEIKWQKNNGKVFWANVNLFPIFKENGEVYSWCNVVRDVTELKKVDQMKTEFVSLASHQLRTPLTGVKWLAELLNREVKNIFTQEQSKLLDDIISSNNRAIKLVDELLDVSHIDTGKNINLKIVSVDVIALINTAVMCKKLLATEKKVTIKLSKTLPKQLVLKVDKEKIQQVFENLIDNSLKYSRPNTSIIIGMKNEKNDTIFYIKDQGIGIPLNKRELIFTKFFRADNAAKVDNTGSGLGLYIIKGILDYHRGKIWFESKENEGSTFYFSLPLNFDKIQK